MVLKLLRVIVERAIHGGFISAPFWGKDRGNQVLPLPQQVTTLHVTLTFLAPRERRHNKSPRRYPGIKSFIKNPL